MNFELDTNAARKGAKAQRNTTKYQVINLGVHFFRCISQVLDRAFKLLNARQEFLRIAQVARITCY
jgi:hypothetical protein